MRKPRAATCPLDCFVNRVILASDESKFRISRCAGNEYILLDFFFCLGTRQDDQSLRKGESQSQLFNRLMSAVHKCVEIIISSV
mmetsp:Transcript_57530/g.130359  ORF Transcript_57530/g.130359 Transcript_57530/m.130359 type:complete len:84 (-) Transcript_57530:919-1170(-)